jgi:hypothetical protein
MKLTLAGLAALAFASQAAFLVQSAAAAPTDPEPEPRAVFKCDKGRQLAIQFVLRDAVFVAVVNSGSGDHALPIVETDISDPQIVWSDGVRMLVWTSGVHLVWMDENNDHLMCGREERHHH